MSKQNGAQRDRSVNFECLAMVRAMPAGWLPAVQRVVLTFLAMHADEDGLAYPGIAELCRQTGYGRRTVVRALDDLVEADHIRVERDHDAKGYRKVNRYRFTAYIEAYVPEMHIGTEAYVPESHAYVPERHTNN